MVKRKYNGAADGITTDVILLAGAGVALYLIVVKPLLTSLGVDPADQNTIDAQKSLPPSQNPFNYQFQPWVDFYNENTPAITTGSGFWGGLEAYLGLDSNVAQVTNPTMQQFFIALKASPGTPSPWALFNTSNLAQIAELINTAVNGFTLTATDQTAAISPFLQLKNQMEVAFIANYFWWNFNTDLLSDLQGSLFKQGMTAANLATLINTVNNLPVQPYA